MSTPEKHKETQFQGLLDTVEELRSAKFAQLDADLVREFLRLHLDATDTVSDLVRLAEQSVDRLASKAKE